jgi:hypothetical protein
MVSRVPGIARRRPEDTMTTTTPITAGPAYRSLDDLALDLDGRLVRPGDPGWHTARQAWHLLVDQRPAAVAQVAHARDVVRVVDAACRLGLRVAPQSTGHNPAPLGDLADTILLRTGALRGVTVDPLRRVARVESGAWWADVTDAVARHGLAALAGSSPDVGVAGYLLGGGLSWLARSHGLAANAVVGIEVVTADGRLRRVDHAHDADLFWALRGGGGSFGVVTALEIRLFPITAVQAGALFFDLDRAHDVLHGWRTWTADLPEAVTSCARVLHLPPLPELPPALAGRSFAVVEVVSQLDETATDALLAPLRALGPNLDTVHRTPMTELSALHMDPPGPTPGLGDGALVQRLDEAAVDAFLDATLAVGPTLLSVELRALGGAVRRPARDGGAVAGFDADAALFAVGIVPDDTAGPRVRLALDTVRAALAPHLSRRSYLNFSEEPRDEAELFGAARDRLRTVKAAYDPHDLIRANHPVRPGSAS